MGLEVFFVMYSSSCWPQKISQIYFIVAGVLSQLICEARKRTMGGIARDIATIFADSFLPFWN